MAATIPEPEARRAWQYERCTVRYLLGPWVEDLLDLAEVQPGQRVLDLACGTGAVARVAAVRAGPAGTVTGLDMDASMLRVAAQLATQGAAALQWQQGDAGAMTFADASFEAVLCQQGLQFFTDRAAALRHVRRVLVRGGRFALAVWDALERNPYSAAMVDAIERHLGPAVAEKVRSPFALGDATALHSLLRQAGFQHLKARVVCKILPQPPLDSFVSEHFRAMSLAPVFAAMEAATRTRMIGEIVHALALHRSDHGVTLPFQVLMVASR